MNLAYLYLYAIVSLIHLYSCFFQKTFTKNCTKPLLMLSLFAYYYTSTNVHSKLLLFSIALSFQGDVYLMFDKGFWFGVVAFWFSDAFYTIILVKEISIVNYTYLSTLITLYLSFYVFVAYKSVWNYLENTKLHGFIFGLPLLSNNLVSVYNLIYSFTYSNLLIVVGTLLYCISDYILLVTIYKRKIKHSNFIIMLTYILAQGSIIGGLTQKTAKNSF